MTTDDTTDPVKGAVLIVVDVQQGFVNDNSQHVVPIVADLAKDWRERGGTVIATRYFNTPNSQWVRFLDWDKLMGPPETDLMPEVAPHVDRILDKTTYTSLTDEVIDLLPEPPAPVYVCGIDTDICVTKTAVDLFERGHQAIVLAHASASHAGPEAHNSALVTLGRFVGRAQVLTAVPSSPAPAGSSSGRPTTDWSPVGRPVA